MTLDTYMQACEERWATDPDYRRRLQLELFDTDARIAAQRQHDQKNRNERTA